MKLRGWTSFNAEVGVEKAVIIAAPHTSNWDAFWGIVFIVANDIRVQFFGKHTLFWFPLGAILRYFGCVPLNRAQAGSAVAQAVRLFADRDALLFAMAPEGTRSYRPHWKSGFYRIARGASVPVLVGVIDYAKKQIGFAACLDLTGDEAADLQRIASLYEGAAGFHPEKMGPIRLKKPE